MHVEGCHFKTQQWMGKGSLIIYLVISNTTTNDQKDSLLSYIEYEFFNGFSSTTKHEALRIKNTIDFIETPYCFTQWFSRNREVKRVK